MPTAPYVRKPPPLPFQYVMGIVMYGIFTPASWVLRKLGLMERAMRRGNTRRIKKTAKDNPFRKYTPGPQDVFVMTYAKSGTNWMMQIAHQLIYHGKGEFNHIHEVVPWPDMEAVPGAMRRYAIPLKDANRWEASPERKRVIKTHYNWELLPYSAEARYIAVIRDPKDVFVSNYFFIKDVIGRAMPPVETWFKMYLEGVAPPNGSWVEYTAGYWAQHQRPNVLIVPFKAMKCDLRGTVRKVATFLGINVSDAVIDEVCRQASFDYMKRIDHKFHVGKIIAWKDSGPMMRKGVQGGSAELLRPEQQREIDTRFQAELKKLQSDFPYEEFADLAH